MVISEENKACCKHVTQNSLTRKRYNITIYRQLLTGQHRKTRESSFLPQLLAEMAPTRPLSLENNKTSAFYRNMNSRRENILVSSVLNSPFKKVCRFLLKLDIEKDFDLISETILHFSLRLYGLPECRSEDLPLAVYLFIEDTFGIQSKIELCVKLLEDGNSNVIGVVFETIRMKYNILKKDVLLEGAEVRLRDNKELGWIIDAFCDY